MVNFDNVVYRSEHASETLAMQFEETIDKEILRASDLGCREYTFDLSKHHFSHSIAIRNKAVEYVAEKYRAEGFTVNLTSYSEELIWAMIEIKW